MKASSVRFGVATLMGVAMAVCLLQVNTRAQYGARGNGAQAADMTPTPMLDGHPDLSGMWGGGGGGGRGPAPDENGNLTVRNKQRPCSAAQTSAGECAAAVNFERDSSFEQRAYDPDEMPQYKPEFWDKIQYMDREGYDNDPSFYCKTEGVPRMGAPNKILQTKTEVILLYGKMNVFRIIPTDGRPHDPIKSQDETWFGDAVGHWDGDTLVVDIVGFNDESWLDWPGYIHSNNMHVIEKYTRKGNTLTWQATVEDPDMMTKPWTMEAHTMRLNPDPKATLSEDPQCEERDRRHIVTKERG